MIARLFRWLGIPVVTNEQLDAIERHLEEVARETR